ncbi:MAG: serine dehydratase subunit alpha family protein [Acidobacteria bacterium]|nr:serine dehydratase subunit alpha family protein [Acidobacteriota bacterium]
MMSFSKFLAEEWRPALGCTEPACIAYAASTAASQATGGILGVRLVCDPRMYKNCFAVGIPHSEHKNGILWATAIGSLLPDPAAKLEVFCQVTPKILEGAGRLLEAGAVSVSVDANRQDLFVDCTVEREGGSGRAVIGADHTNLVLIEKDGRTVMQAQRDETGETPDVRRELADLSVSGLLEFAAGMTGEDRRALDEGVALNLAIAEHGDGLLAPRFAKRHQTDRLAQISRLVFGGIYARMSGEDYVVMTLAGSGNKGITASVPLKLWGDELGASDRAVEDALAVACAVASAATWHLGSLSAMCGTVNAAGVGLAAGIVCLEGGGADEVSMAITNMVGNVTGVICDGAKIGCGLKGMTAVDSAFRAASLALAGVVIPFSDGVVGEDGRSSLANLGRIAGPGMLSTDGEILAIMGEKLAKM